MVQRDIKEITEIEDESPVDALNEQEDLVKLNVSSFWRPTKYRPEFAWMLIDFMSRSSHEVAINRTYYQNKDNPWRTGWLKSEKHVVLTETYPTLQRFAFNIGVHIDTLYEWEKVTYPEDIKEVDTEWNSLAGKLKYPDFSEAIKRARQIQESILVENALAGHYNPQFSIFLAKNWHWFKDKTETDVTTDWKSLNFVVKLPE